MNKNRSSILNTAVVIGALGYFVDIYDLVLFSIVRVASLKSIGIAEDQLMDVGLTLINMQMGGMLVGGLLWGVLGDKRGRVSVLFGSIFLYSMANIANAFVTSVESYSALRFIAGVGLAGELGAAITLVSEVMSKENRGIGTTIVASVGICGAIAAGVVGEAFSWQTAYLVGGVLGLLLLVARLKSYESGLFQEAKDSSSIQRGDLKLLFSSQERVLKYLRCILIGVPLWYVVGILITFSPELAKHLGVTGPVSAGTAIMVTYAALAVGDVASGLFSQWMRSRKKAMSAFLILNSFAIILYFVLRGISPFAFYCVCAVLGFASGYWAMFVTISSEQFGTNLRATVTTTVPNFVRAAVLPLTFLLRAFEPQLGLLGSAFALGVLCTAIAFLALRGLPETFGKDLQYFDFR